MKHLLSFALLVGLCTPLMADVNFQENAGIGVVVPDNGDLDSAPVGKVDVQWNVKPSGRFAVLLGVSGTKTGTFGRSAIPRDVQYVNSTPQAFAGKKYQDHHGDVIVIEGDTSNVFITDAPDRLPNRPVDSMERSFWATDAFTGLGYEVGPFAPYFTFLVYGKAGIGASGVNQYNGDSRIGLTQTLSAGVEFNALALVFGFEAIRRHTQTEINSHGSWAYMGKIGLKMF